MKSKVIKMLVASRIDVISVWLALCISFIIGCVVCLYGVLDLVSRLIFKLGGLLMVALLLSAYGCEKSDIAPSAHEITKNVPDTARNNKQDSVHLIIKP